MFFKVVLDVINLTVVRDAIFEQAEERPDVV
jgi:hypothetical protein